MHRLAIFALTLAVLGCSDHHPTTDTQVADTLTAKWSRTCALCHVNGEGGAPRMGNTEEWSPRLAQGEATLLAHTVEGFNNMPPLGYCMSCERKDFQALIKLMTGNPQWAD